MKEVRVRTISAVLYVVTICAAVAQTSTAKCKQHNEKSLTNCGDHTVIVTASQNTFPTRFTEEWHFARNNITTIINVSAIINNTDLNNSHIYSDKTTKRDSGPCCSVVRPKTCRKSIDGAKCRHRRHNTCGDRCKSHTMHTQVKRKCRPKNGCHRHTIYIPEPVFPPRCISIYRWPYTLCGKYRQSTSCDGCYDHYEYGGHGNRGCFGCYDDGFDSGPLYRRGPVLRPFYYHVPPCELTGICNGYGPNTLDEEYIVWDERDTEHLDDSDYEGSGEFGKISTKCREIDDTAVIRNCSKSDVHWDKQLSSNARLTRNSRRRRRPQVIVVVDPTASYITPQRIFEEDMRPDYIKFVDDDDNNNFNYEPRSNKYTRKHRHRQYRFPIDEEDLTPIEEDNY